MAFVKGSMNFASQMPQREERSEHGPPDRRQGVVTEIYCVELEELGEGVFGNVLHLIVADVQHLDPLHRRHRDLGGNSMDLKNGIKMV